MATKTRKFSLWTFADRFEGDKVVWIILLMLCLISIVCMFSSTSRLLKGDTTRLDLVREQAILVGAGLVVIIIMYNIRNIKVFRWCSMVFGFSVPFLLLLLLDLRIRIPNVIEAIYVNGAYRILQVGSLQIHVFEVVKVAMVLYLAWALDAFRKGELKGARLSPLWKKILYIYAPFLIIFVMILPGGNSSAVFIGGIMFLVILLGGGNFKDLLVLFTAGILIIGACYGIYKASDGEYMERIGTAISRVSEPDWEEMFLDSRPGTDEYQKALDKLLDNPQKPSLKWGFKLSKIDIFLDGIDPDRIPLKYVPILFRSLKIGSLMPTGNVITIDLLDRIVGNSPGYTMQYLEGNNLSNAESLALIEKWEEIFKQNKEHILKKRYYKNKYFGKKVAN